MQKIILLNKKEGQTPLEALEFFRSKNKEYQGLKMTYAGRLDPMASGLLIVLVDEKIKDKDKFLKLDKEYDFEILFGFATDTYDILGKVTKSKNIDIKKEDLERKIKKELKNFTGKFIQKYPIYSSKTVSGKQLFQYARSGQDVDIPERGVEVKKIKLNKIVKIKGDRIKKEITKRVGQVNGDFRQKEIVKTWDKKISEDSYFFLVNVSIKCSSGTYVRGIASSLGKRLDIPALAWNIKRTKVGKYKMI